MKRVLSLVLALVMVFGTIMPAFAEDAATTSADSQAVTDLMSYGIIAGTENGADEAKVLLREQMATILAKAYGKFDEAKAFEFLPSFTDVQDSEYWATPYVAFAAKEGWMSGDAGTNTFRLQDPTKAQEFNSLLLNALGYDTKWEEVNAKATALGIAVVAADPNSVLRGEAFVALRAALDVPKMDTTVKLGTALDLPNFAKAVEVVSAVALTTTMIEVKFTQAVDAVAAANFLLNDAAVTAASLSEDKMTAKLTVAPLSPTTDYKLVVTGVNVDAVKLADITLTLKVGEVTSLYNPTLVASTEVVKADGASQAIITFSLKDSLGKVITNAQNVEVAFSTTFGNFAQSRVALQNGEAKLVFNSEFLTADKVADLRGIVVEAQDANLIGLRAETTLLLSPNPDEAKLESLGASMNSAESNQADRVIVYFNKAVDVNNFLQSKKGVEGIMDATKVAVTVHKNSTSSSTGTPVIVKGLMPVQGNDKALQILLDVESSWTNALTDNSNVYVSFTDKTGSVDVQRTTTFKLTDARKPAMLSVANDGLTKLVVTFSESVSKATSTNLDNWSIDGISLNHAKWNNPTVTVGTFTNKTGVDARHTVTIKMGTGVYLQAGTHSVQASNVIDWTGMLANKMETQTLDFAIAEDNSAPVGSVEVQSPEQWLVSYTRDVAETAADFTTDVTLEVYNNTANTWGPATMGIIVTKTDSNEFLVETTSDWTVNQLTATSGINHFNKNYRLSIVKNAVTNVANGKKNAAQALGLGGAITAPDTTSPVISLIEEHATVAGTYVATMSEPVKLNATANTETITLAQTQTALPVVTASFIKADLSKTIDGSVAATFADKYEKKLTVTPNEKLTAGEWILVIRSISDDVGNTAPSATANFVVTADSVAVASDDFSIMWIEENVATEKLLIKFTQPVSISGGVVNALATTNYTLNGLALPIGTYIHANIIGYDDYDTIIDSVTIQMPTALDTLTTTGNILNVSTSLVSSTGKALTNGGEHKLNFNRGNNTDVPNVVAVTNTATLKAALANTKLYTIVLANDITLTEPLTISRNINLNLGAHTLTATAPNKLTVKHAFTGNTTIQGAGGNVTLITVNTPKAEFVVAANATVNNLVVDGIYTNTVKVLGTVAQLNMNVNGKVRVDTGGTVTNAIVKKNVVMTVDTTPSVDGDPAGSIPTITGEGTVKSGASTGVAGTFAKVTEGKSAVQATATITFAGTWLNGETFQVDEKTYTVSTTSTAIEVAAAMATAINGDGTAKYTATNAAGTAVVTLVQDTAANTPTLANTETSVAGTASVVLTKAGVEAVQESYSLTVTAHATVSGTIYVNRDGVALPVAILAGQSTTTVATSIETALTASFTSGTGTIVPPATVSADPVVTWTVSRTGSVITISANVAEARVDITGSL